MKTRLLAIALLVCPTALFAQSSSFGFLVGGSESLEDGLDVSLGNSVTEVFFGVNHDMGTSFRIKAGQVDTDDNVRSGEVAYIQGLVDYEVDQPFGSTTLFAGPSIYRSRPDGDADDETEFGFAGGVSGDFPITRRFSFIVELAYHWANFEDPYRFVTATGGLKARF